MSKNEICWSAYANHNAVQTPCSNICFVDLLFSLNQGAMIRPKKLWSLETVLKWGLCSTPGLFIYSRTSACVSCIYILQRDVKDDKTIHKKQQQETEQIETIPLFIKGSCNLRRTQQTTPEYALWVQSIWHVLCHGKAEIRSISGQLLSSLPKPWVPKGFQKAENVREARSGRNQQNPPSHCSEKPKF